MLATDSKKDEQRHSLHPRVVFDHRLEGHLMNEDADHYYLVKLMKGPVWEPGLSLDLVAMQFRHMRNLWRLRKAKQAILASPVAGDGDLRGVVILKVGSENEARALIERDLAVVSGRLSYEITPF